MAAMEDVKCHHAPGHTMNQVENTTFVARVVVLLTFRRLICLTFITEVEMVVAVAAEEEVEEVVVAAAAVVEEEEVVEAVAEVVEATTK